MSTDRSSTRLAPDIERILNIRRCDERTPRFAGSEIRRETLRVTMRDGVRLATDLYLPPSLPASAIALRTPYGRAASRTTGALLTFARHGYVVIAQDCRGTGDSEPAVWDYSVYEMEDGNDLVQWATRQDWFDGFLFSCGGSYVATTQWCMSTHPRMSAIAPEVGGLRTLRSTVRKYMFVNGYSRVTGKGANRLVTPHNEIERHIEAETMAGGYFNAPLHAPLPEPLLESYPVLRTLGPVEAKRWIWRRCCELPAAGRVALLKQMLGVDEFSYQDSWSLPSFFDSLIPYGLQTLSSLQPSDLCRRFHAPALIISGWYDWNLEEVLSTWTMFRREALPNVAARTRLLITPAAHHVSGYHEGAADHPELQHDHRMNVDLLLRWYDAVRGERVDEWPTVIYYLMGANEWRTASDWPAPDARQTALYLGTGGALSFRAPAQHSEPDSYSYDPVNPTPTVGGSILSFLYPVGSVDVSAVQKRLDVLTYTTAVLEHDLDVVGPLRLILYASSSAVDTDFVGRLSDVFPDGRAIQLQSGILRVRYRVLTGSPELIEPGRIYRFEIDLWATANRFKAGHCVRLDISSADFPRFDRNANRGGEPGEPIVARQTIYHDAQHPSHLLLSIMDSSRHETDASSCAERTS